MGTVVLYLHMLWSSWHLQRVVILILGIAKCVSNARREQLSFPTTSITWGGLFLDEPINITLVRYGESENDFSFLHSVIKVVFKRFSLFTIYHRVKKCFYIVIQIYSYNMLTVAMATSRMSKYSPRLQILHWTEGTTAIFVLESWRLKGLDLCLYH